MPAQKALDFLDARRVGLDRMNFAKRPDKPVARDTDNDFFPKFERILQQLFVALMEEVECSA